MKNEKRLISLDETFKAISDEIWWTESEKAYFRHFLIKQKPVDAMEVVRCKDCEHYRKNLYDPDGDMWCKCWADWLPTEPDDFCSYGERKDNG